MTATATRTWTLETIGKAHDLHIHLLGGPTVTPTGREDLVAASPELRQAARTIAACMMPSAALPTDPELGPMLPLNDALQVFSGDENWLDLPADMAEDFATEILIKLQRHYDVSEVSAADVIGAMPVDPSRIDAVQHRYDMLQLSGDGEGSLARGLERAVENARFAM